MSAALDPEHDDLEFADPGDFPDGNPDEDGDD
jgi:hypothetical protein